MRALALESGGRAASPQATAGPSPRTRRGTRLRALLREAKDAAFLAGSSTGSVPIGTPRRRARRRLAVLRASISPRRAPRTPLRTRPSAAREARAAVLKRTRASTRPSRGAGTGRPFAASAEREGPGVSAPESSAAAAQESFAHRGATPRQSTLIALRRPGRRAPAHVGAVPRPGERGGRRACAARPRELAAPQRPARPPPAAQTPLRCRRPRPARLRLRGARRRRRRGRPRRRLAEAASARLGPMPARRLLKGSRSPAARAALGARGESSIFGGRPQDAVVLRRCRARTPSVAARAREAADAAAN